MYFKRSGKNNSSWRNKIISKLWYILTRSEYFWFMYSRLLKYLPHKDWNKNYCLPVTEIVESREYFFSNYTSFNDVINRFIRPYQQWIHQTRPIDGSNSSWLSVCILSKCCLFICRLSNLSWVMHTGKQCTNVCRSCSRRISASQKIRSCRTKADSNCTGECSLPRLPILLMYSLSCYVCHWISTVSYK